MAERRAFRQRALAPLAALAMIVVFLGLSCYRLDRPGLYYDEVLFVPAALEAAGDCAVEAAVSKYWGECWPVWLSPPYIGALKSWLHAPVFAAFGFNVASVRLPSILLSALMLWLLFGFLRARLGAALSLAALLVLATDPAFIEHNRLDLGPFAIANACKLVGLFALWRWLEQGRSSALALALLALSLGFFDKLNFIWLIGAFGLAAVLLFPQRILQNLRRDWPRQTLLIAATLILVVAGSWSALRDSLALPIDTPVHADFVGRFHHVLDLYTVTFNGTAAFNWVFRVDLAGTGWPNYVLIGQFALAIPVLFAAWRRGRCGVGSAGGLLAFLTIAITALFLQLAATPQVSGSHHLMALWPLPTLHAVALLATLGELWPVWREFSTRPLLAAIALLLAGAALGQNLRVEREFLAGRAGQVPFEGRWDPAIEALAGRLAEGHADLVIATDWGVFNQLLGYAAEPERSKYHDWWPLLAEPPEPASEQGRWLREDVFRDRVVRFVGFVDAQTIMPEGERKLPGLLPEWGMCAQREETLPGSDGQPLYRIREVRFGAACALTDAAP